jgi:integrase
MKAFTPLSIKAIKPGVSRREIPDAGCRGLYLIVQASPSGSKSWAYRYRFNGKPKKLTIGDCYLGRDEPDRVELGLAATLRGARQLASEAALQVAKGVDPAASKSAAKAETKQRAVVLEHDRIESVIETFLEKHARPNMRPVSLRECERILGVVSREWQGRAAGEITRRDVHALLDGIASRGAPVMANRVLAQTKTLFNWAVSRDLVPASPCAGVKPIRGETSRDRVLSDHELSLIWKAADRIGYPWAGLVQTLILTCQRRGEVAGMRHTEIRGDTWVLPKERCKNGIAHEVPLSPEMRALIEAQPRIGHGAFVFTASGGPEIKSFSASKRAIDGELVKMGAKLAPWIYHDLRRSGASGMARLGVALPVIEKCLNHTSGSFRGIVGVYQRHDYAGEKREALNLWAKHIMSVI